MKRILSNKYIIGLFLAPALLIFSIFIIYPLLPTIMNSFFHYSIGKTGEFVRLANYIDTFNNPTFWLSIRNTGKVLLVQIFIAGPLSLLFALAIERRSEKVKRFFKIACFIPSVLNIAVISLMWKMILQPDWGLLDVFLNAVGLERLIRVWLIDSKTAMWAIAGVFLWQYIGFNMILFYSGIKSIPQYYLEAARIEGVNIFQEWIHITIPLIQETFRFVLILTTAGCLGMFAQVQILTGGGPGDLTRTVVYQLYYEGFILLDFGKANAIAVLYAVFGTLLLILINNFVARKRVEYV